MNHQIPIYRTVILVEKFKSVAHYTSHKAKYGGLFLFTQIKLKSDIFSRVAKSYIVYTVNSVAEQSECQLRKQLYFGKAKVILNKSLTLHSKISLR